MGDNVHLGSCSLVPQLSWNHVIVLICSKSCVYLELFLATFFNFLGKKGNASIMQLASSKETGEETTVFFCCFRYEGGHQQWGARWTKQLHSFYPKISFSFISVACFVSVLFHGLATASKGTIAASTLLCSTLAIPAALSIY